ncbi:8609_t:CDS:2, partial [Dentiscutata erythropus]
RIINALKLFDQATKFFSGSKYPTLSIMYSIIHELQNKFIEFSLELSNDNENSDNKDDMLLDSENDDDIPPPPPDFDQIEKQFKIAITDSLNKYWHKFQREKAKTKLRNEFENLHLNITSNDQPEQQALPSMVTEIMQNLFFEGIFGVRSQEDTPLDEVYTIYAKKVKYKDTSIIIIIKSVVTLMSTREMSMKLLPHSSIMADAGPRDRIRPSWLMGGLETAFVHHG